VRRAKRSRAHATALAPRRSTSTAPPQGAAHGAAHGSRAEDRVRTAAAGKSRCKAGGAACCGLCLWGGTKSSRLERFGRRHHPRRTRPRGRTRRAQSSTWRRAARAGGSGGRAARRKGGDRPRVWTCTPPLCAPRALRRRPRAPRAVQVHQEAVGEGAPVGRARGGQLHRGWSRHSCVTGVGGLVDAIVAFLAARGSPRSASQGEAPRAYLGSRGRAFRSAP
jgi:hypothetical protein